MMTKMTKNKHNGFRIQGSQVVTPTDKEVYDFFFAGDTNFGDNALVAHHKEMVKECLEITRSKNHDYAGDQDPLANFRMCEQFGVSMEKGILIRLTDKLSRIARLLDNPAQVKDESIHDTLVDTVNYAMILDYALKERNENTSNESS